MLVKKYLDGVEITSVDKNILTETLKKIAERIKVGHPEIRKIYLFGSFSKNNFMPYSDVDIAIIVAFNNKNFIIRQDDFIDYFREIPQDVNLLIYTESEIKKMQDANSIFIREVLDGVEL